MKKKLILTSLLMSFSLSSCNYSENVATISNNNVEISSKKVNKNIESLIDKSRMESYIKVFTGKSPVSANNFIPERGTPEGRELTRKFISDTLKNLGYDVQLHNYRKNGTNVIAKLMADTPTDEFIVMGAHMDSVKNNGADDNASGSTAILEAATILPKLEGRKVNILFIWFDEEELGLIGSSYLASEYKKQKMKISSVHTIDMLGWDSDGNKGIEVARPDGILWGYYNMVNKNHNLNYPLTRTSTSASDHSSFSKNGFPSVCLSEEWTLGDTTPHYHRSTDKFETINLDYLSSALKLIVAVVGDLSLKVTPPSNTIFIPHDKFPARERHFHTEPIDHK
ncbi:MAG: M28 family metallopeptidase [Candidatus Sericytochromatia bacterium]